MKHLRFSAYHSSLRVSVLLVAVLLLFDSGVLSPITKQFSDHALHYTANVIGVGAAVAPNELNTWTAALTERERDLDRRERELNVGLNNETGLAGVQISTYILSALLFVLLVLIILNYSLDLARERQLRILTKQLSHE